MRQQFKALICAALYPIMLVVRPRSNPRGIVPFLFLLTLSLASCGGGDDDMLCDSEFRYLYDCPPEEVTVYNFQVFGNVPPVNGREQIVAAIDNGTFQIVIDIGPEHSDDATIWISDLADLQSTNFEQRVAHFTCGFLPFCHYKFVFNCSFTVDNRVACGMRSGGSGPIQESYPIADVASLLSGNQADLVIVLRVDAGPYVTATQRILPVTFRYN